MLSDPDVPGLASAVSAYEMSYKHHRGNWPEIADLAAAFEEIVEAERFELLPLAVRHAIRAGSYPREHRDPFYRMLVAQAMVEGVALVSKDDGLRAMRRRCCGGEGFADQPLRPFRSRSMAQDRVQARLVSAAIALEPDEHVGIHARGELLLDLATESPAHCVGSLFVGEFRAPIYLRILR